MLAGALRVAEALEGGATSLVGVWQRAPLQAIARLHALAAADLTDDDRLGRPRADAGVGRRLEMLGDVVTRHAGARARCWPRWCTANCSRWRPFGVADGVVARAVSRLVTIASGLDTHGLGVPEMYWMRKSGDYRAAARGFASGTPRGSGRVADQQQPRIGGRCARGAVDCRGVAEVTCQQSEAGGAPNVIRLAAR